MKIRILALYLLSALAAGCVTKDDIVVLDDRIFQIEQRQQALENRLANIADIEARIKDQLAASTEANQEEIQALRSQLAGFRVETTRLREDFQELTGRVEEAEFRLRRRDEGGEQAGERLESRQEQIASTTAENNRRIRQLEQYLNLEVQQQQEQPSGPENPSPAPAPAPAEAPGTAQAQDAAGLYGAARQAFDEGNLAEARQTFQELLKRFPDSNQADNAQFWIGETYYRENWYEKAILEYQKVIENYPEGNKLPAALLKQGFAFARLGDNANARLIWKELVRKHPDSNEAKIAEDKLKTLD